MINNETQWWLCYFLQKYGKGSITDTTTGSALGSPSTPMGKINAMKALLAANYTDYNTCQFVPVTTNSGAFVASYTGAPNQIDCSGTYFPNYAAPATLHTSCQAIFENGTVSLDLHVINIVADDERSYLFKYPYVSMFNRRVQEKATGIRVSPRYMMVA